MTNKKSKNAIVLLTRYPNNIWLNFLNNFNNYDTFVCIDNNDKDFVQLFKIPNSKITFIQVDDDFCKAQGFFDALFPTGSLPRKVLSWDKALFYFSNVNRSYQNVWFIEDDVFFLKESVIQNIDSKYHDSDLLTPENFINFDGNLNTWELWFTIKDKLNLPWCKSMTCACRISNKLLGLIKNYVSNNNSLTFHEALFNTLAYQNNCKINTPTELSTIHYRTEWNIYELNLNNLYHPIKDINIHNNLRCNNNLYFDNLYNNVDYNNAKNPENLNFERYLLPSDFNFCCYRENNDMRNWPDEAIMWHWFKYGQYENRKYKD